MLKSYFLFPNILKDHQKISKKIKKNIFLCITLGVGAQILFINLKFRYNSREGAVVLFNFFSSPL